MSGMMWRRGAIVALLPALLWAAAGKASAADVSPEQVKEAIKRAVQYLQREQRPDGSWTPYNHYDITGLCTLALLQAGLKPDDPPIRDALTHLRKPGGRPSSTYEMSLQTMVLCAAGKKTDVLQIQRNAKWFEDNQIAAGEAKGAWSYPNGRGDNSNTQFALLALHEAERAGVKVKDETWRSALGYWQRMQNPDGSWGYLPNDGSGSASMTCAGISSVVIAAGRLNEGEASANGKLVNCCGQQSPNLAVERALAWLGQTFSVHNNSGGSGQWLLYYLYGVERVGRLTSRRFIGDHDWYREGTDMLVRAQDQLSGFWVGAGHVEDIPTVGTSLALLFIAKGRRPVLLARAKHGLENDGDWNHHQSSLGNLTSYVETKWQRDLTWQVIDVEAATPDDLMQAPVLFINGQKRLEYGDQQVKDLREYINRGGFVFAEACCSDAAGFHRDFEKLMARVFPEPEYKLRELEPSHPVWQAEEKIPPEHLRPLWGLDYGCRTSVIYVPAHPQQNPGPALSCLWELAKPGRDKPLDPAVESQIAAANSYGINILAYATNRELKYKEEIPMNAPKAGKQDALERAKLHIGKVKHNGGWNVAPAALVNLQTALGREAGLRVGTDQRELNLADKSLFDYHVIFMHGKNEFRLSDAEKKQLRTFLERGGVLLADAVCASNEFDRAFRREIGGLMPDASLEKIPSSHLMLTPEYGGFDLKSVTRRDPQRGTGKAEATLRKVEPDLEGVKLANRYAVIYSRYDLSCALENHESLECQGYVRDDAAKIGINLVLYALHE